MEEALRSRDKMIDEKNVLLKEKEELVDTLDTALATNNGVIKQLHHLLHRNYYNLVHLGSRCYRDKDLAERLQHVWERSDRKRMMELEELSVWVPIKYKREPSMESFELPLSRLYT